MNAGIVRALDGVAGSPGPQGSAEAPRDPEIFPATLRGELDRAGSEATPPRSPGAEAEGAPQGAEVSQATPEGAELRSQGGERAGEPASDARGEGERDVEREAADSSQGQAEVSAAQAPESSRTPTAIASAAPLQPQAGPLATEVGMPDEPGSQHGEGSRSTDASAVAGRSLPAAGDGPVRAAEVAGRAPEGELAGAAPSATAARDGEPLAVREPAEASSRPRPERESPATPAAQRAPAAEQGARALAANGQSAPAPEISNGKQDAGAASREAAPMAPVAERVQDGQESSARREGDADRRERAPFAPGAPGAAGLAEASESAPARRADLRGTPELAPSAREAAAAELGRASEAPEQMAARVPTPAASEAGGAQAAVGSPAQAPPGAPTQPGPGTLPQPPEAIPTHVEWLARRGGGSARITLHPAELGELQLQVRVRGDQVEVVLAAERHAAQELVQEARDGLAHSLAARDLRLDHFEVRSLDRDASGRAGTQGSPDGAGQGGERGRSDGEGRGSGGRIASEAAAAAVARESQSGRSAPGGVDVRV